MKKSIVANLFILILIILGVIGCGGGSSSRTGSDPSVPAAPTSLTAVFSAGKISLNWTASTGSLKGYNIYRSSNYGQTFSKINSSFITNPSFEDNPTDGMYYYQVTAVGENESLPSNLAKNAIGTRLSGPYNSGCNLTSGSYVIDDQLTVNGGDLTVQSGVSLYILDHAEIDIEASRYFAISGLVRVEATTTHPATFTSHKTGGGTPDNKQGFYLRFTDTAVDFDLNTGAGTLIQNTNISMLATIGSSIMISHSSPNLSNLKITANTSNPLDSCGSLQFFGITGAIVQNSAFHKVFLDFSGSVSSSFKFEHNFFENTRYPLTFLNINPNLTIGQVANNNFYCAAGASPIGRIYISGIGGNGTIPLDNNYWRDNAGQVVPVIVRSSTDWTASVATTLTSPPTTGPNW